MITNNEIEEFLHGNDPEKYLVAVEFDYMTNSIYKVVEPPNEPKRVVKDRFVPFCWVGSLKGLNFYQNSAVAQKSAMSKYGITLDKLKTGDDSRMESGLTYLVKSTKGYRELVQFFKDGGLDPWSEKAKDRILILPAVEQYLISREKRLFKGFADYDEITRLVFDLETSALDPKDGRIFMIGIKTNKGYSRVIECIDQEEEKSAIIEFFKVIDELKPSIIGGYNSANFDWHWIVERSRALDIDINKVCKSLNPKVSLTRKKSIIKLANEVEEYIQTSLWGYNMIDIIHSVRRAMAINSNIKSAGLKYITKYIGAEAKDRVYIDHDKIGKMYADKEEFWLNKTNGNYRRASEFNDLDKKHPDTYVRITGDRLVEEYLYDDLDETLKVDKEFNQASFLMASMIPTTYERVSTMGTASLWKTLMLAWSYKNGLAIPKKDEKRDFVGGLSRLLKVGYSTNVVKLDFSSLYPSIQLVHNVFPDCDITGAMKSMLKYFRDTRIKYKQMAEDLYETNPILAASYSNKQLPIKIFINSMFGSLSAPQVFPWGDMFKGEQITCTGRQYLRQMVTFFMDRGYVPLVMDTDGVNFSSPEGVENREYVGKGLSWKVKKDKVYKGPEADVAEYNDKYMRNEMALDTDGTWPSCINIARKNYAVLDSKGKVKLTGNSIKSKKLPLYIEDFLDKSIKMLLEGKGSDFINYYYEYLTKIYNKEIPLSRIAQRAKVKLTVADYKSRLTKKNKAGSSMSRMAHMELAIQNGVNVNLGDVIMFVNNGEKMSHGDVQKLNKPKNLVEGETYPEFKLNCYMLDPDILEKNPDMLGDYNVPKSISAFNKRIEPLLVVFGKTVRENLLVDNPTKFNVFTKHQSELISGLPFEEGDQDNLTDVLNMSEAESAFWSKVGIDPNYIYDIVD